nr:MAG TPA: hypothetical protein [Caudoviricetes sp.]
MMDAVEFLDKVDRLSKRGSTEEKMRYNDYRTARDNTRAVKFVEQWAAEHPVKTRQSEFLKQWPEADVDENGVLQTCPALISASHRDQTGGCATLSNKCENCRKAFWFTEVEE